MVYVYVFVTIILPISYLTVQKFREPSTGGGPSCMGCSTTYPWHLKQTTNMSVFDWHVVHTIVDVGHHLQNNGWMYLRVGFCEKLINYKDRM